VNDISSAIRKFNRFELKYLLPIEAAGLFRQEIGAYLKPDSYGNDEGGYVVSSLYYDSPDFRFYWEKMEGIRFRRKLRTRYYETQAELTSDTGVFVEIKQRLDRVTQKRRAWMPYRDALQLCNERVMPEHRPQDRMVIEEILALVWQYGSTQICGVAYPCKEAGRCCDWILPRRRGVSTMLHGPRIGW
jgi:hypothetical protein